MGKAYGNRFYSEPGDREHEEGVKSEYSKVLVKFGKEKLDKMFDSWIIIGRDIDPKNYKEVGNGGLMSGAVILNPGDEYKDRKDQRASLAMMMLDAVESFCGDEEEVESFLEALWKTAKKMHKEEDSEDEDDEKDSDSKEDMKIEILKGFINTCVDAFDTFEGKRKYAVACITSVLPAMLLEKGSSKTRKAVREEMKRSIQNGELADSALTSSIDGLAEIVNNTLDMVDDDASPEDILNMFRSVLTKHGH